GRAGGSDTPVRSQRLPGRNAAMTRPEDLARDLGIPGKKLRDWLRARYPRSSAEHGQAWFLTDEQVRAARSRFGGTNARIGVDPASAAPPRTMRRAMSSGGRAASDESYVIDLCDEILGERAERQKRF